MILRAYHGLAIAGLLALSTQAHSAVFSDVTLGQAGASGFNLGVFVTGPTTFSASNSSTLFNGNVGLASGATTNVSGGGTIGGNLYKDPGATLQANFGTQMTVSGSTITTSLAQALLDVQSAATAAASLAPNQTYGSVGGSALTLTPTGFVNLLGGRSTVVQIADITITNPSNNLTISGGANDFYIINVASDIAVSNGAITTTGGILASNILFNITGTSASKEVVLTNSTSLLTGTYLAPFQDQLINLAPGTVNGAVIGYTIQTSSGPTVNSSVFDVPSGGGTPVPEPMSAGALGAGMAAMLFMRRRR